MMFIIVVDLFFIAFVVESQLDLTLKTGEFWKLLKMLKVSKA